MTHPPLEELESIALKATKGRWHRMADVIRTVVGEPIVFGYATNIDEMEQCKANLAHIAANSPDVTLALIARVRELEAAARAVVRDVKWCEPGPEFVCARDSCRALTALRALLAKENHE